VSIPESEIQVKLWCFLTNLIDRKVSFDGIEFTEVKVKKPNIDGFPDLVVYASEKGKGLQGLFR